MTSESVWVFDMDDTLYLERDYVRSGFDAVDAWARETMSLEGVGERAWTLFLAGARNTTLSDAFADCGRRMKEHEVSDVVAVYRAHTPTIALCVDASEALERLFKTCSIAVITDGPPVSQRAKAAALRLSRYANPIVFTGEFGPQWHKPRPLAFAHVESVLHARPESCTYVADNPLKDFSAPNKRGWQCIRVIRPGGLHEAHDSVPGEVDQVVTSLACLGRTRPQEEEANID